MRRSRRLVDVVWFEMGSESTFWPDLAVLLMLFRRTNDARRFFSVKRELHPRDPHV